MVCGCEVAVGTFWLHELLAAFLRIIFFFQLLTDHKLLKDAD